MKRSSTVIWGAFFWAIASCAQHPTRPSSEQSLDGISLQLKQDGFSAKGQVGSVGATIRFDVLRPLSAIGRDCFVFPPEHAGFVRVPGFDVRERDVPMVWVKEAFVEGRFLGHRRMELLPSGAGCVLVLGSELLLPYAFRIDSVARQVRLTPSSLSVSMPEGYVVWPINKEPRSDMPLVAVFLHAEGRHIPLTLGLSTFGVSEVASQWVPAEGPLQLELLPGVWVNEVSFSRAESSLAARFDGKLGADVYGRFDGLLDIKAGVFGLKVEAVAPRKLEKVPSVPGATEPDEPD